MAAKKAMVHRRRFLKIYSLKFCDIWQNFDFYRILNNENFKMEVEQKNFVIHLIITMQLYYWLSENPSVKLWSNKIQMVMINYSQLCASLYENLMSEFYVNWVKVKSIQSFMFHGNDETVTFYLSIKIFYQYIFHLPTFSLWAATFLLPWFDKWHILTNCQNCAQPP